MIEWNSKLAASCIAALCFLLGCVQAPNTNPEKISIRSHMLSKLQKKSNISIEHVVLGNDKEMLCVVKHIADTLQGFWLMLGNRIKNLSA